MKEGKKISDNFKLLREDGRFLEELSEYEKEVAFQRLADEYEMSVFRVIEILSTGETMSDQRGVYGVDFQKVVEAADQMSCSAWDTAEELAHYVRGIEVQEEVCVDYDGFIVDESPLKFKGKMVIKNRTITVRRWGDLKYFLSETFRCNAAGFGYLSAEPYRNLFDAIENKKIGRPKRF